MQQVDLPGARRSDPLLVTKLCPSPPRAERVPGVAGKLTLLSVPAGYGKSTLLLDWVAACLLPVAWVALDEGDSDPARFRSYVIAALRALSPEVREQTPEVPGELREAPIEPAVAALINALASLSDREIADTLYVTVGAVKRHTNSIYGKLGVNTRGRAVARARELQIITM